MIMASNRKLEPSENTANYNRLSILLIGGGTAVLRYLLVRYLLQRELRPHKKWAMNNLAPPQTKLLYPELETDSPDKLPCLKKLDYFLIKKIFKICFPNSGKIPNRSRDDLEEEIVKNMKGQKFENFISDGGQRKIISRKFSVGTTEYDILTKKHVNIEDLDISLLTYVLQDHFKVKPSSKDKDGMPRAEDTTVGDDIMRIRNYRNIMFHDHLAGISKTVYEQQWNDITSALIRIGGEQVRLFVENLKTAPLDPEKEKEWRNVMFERHESDMELKIRLKDLTDVIKRKQLEQQTLQKTPIIREKFIVRNRGEVTSSDTEYQQDSRTEDHEEDNQTPFLFRFKEFSLGRPPSELGLFCLLLSWTLSMTSDGCSMNLPLFQHFMQAEVKSWKQNESLVYETKAYESVSCTLKATNYVTITGGQRSGKSMLGRHEALQLQKEGYDIYPLSKPDEIRRFCCSSKKQIFFFDDPFGQQSINLVDLSVWKACDEEIRCALKKTDMKIIIVMSTEIHSQLGLQNCHSVMMDNVVNITDGKLQLTRSDKIQILRKHLEHSGQRRYEADSISYRLELAIAGCEFDSFPFLCQVYTKHDSLGLHPENFFINPFSTVKKTLQQIRSDNPNLFCGLLLCAVLDGLSEDVFDLFQDHEELAYKREAVDTCARAMSLKPRGCYDSIRKQLDCQAGLLLDVSNGVYRLVNPLYKEVILFLFAKISVDFLFKYFTSGMIRERVRIGKLLPLDNEQAILVLEERHWDKLGKRLQIDVKSFSFADVFQNPYIGEISIEKAVCEAIEDMGDNINFLDSRSLSMLHWSVLTNNLRLTIHLLTLGADVCVGDGIGIPVLLTAIKCYLQKQKQCRRYEGEPIKISDSSGATEQSCQIIHLLLDHNANVSARDRDKNFAILEAINQENVELVKLLLSKYSEADKQDCVYDVVQTVAVAVKHKNLDIVQLLLKNTPTIVHWTDKDGFNVLWLAVVSEDTDMINLFHQYGADVNRRNARGQTALMIASERNDWKSVKLLLELKADINIVDAEGNTALIISVRKGNCRIATLLVEHGANIDIQNKEGNDALNICKICCREILDLLSSKISK